MSHESCLTIRSILEKLSTLSSFPKDQYKILTSKCRQLGLFSSEPVAQRETVMRALSALLEQKCQFQEGEVDIVLLQHTFEIERADGKMETMTSTLEAYGDRNGGYSAMVRPLTDQQRKVLINRLDLSVSHVVLPSVSSLMVSSPSQESTPHTMRR